MEERPMSRVSLLLVVSLCFIVAASAEEITGQWRPMWLAVRAPGLSEVAIEALTPSGDARKAGVTERLLHDAVELTLRRNAIGVTSDPGFWTPRLEIKAGTLTVKDGGTFVLHVYTVDIVL
jgi:hypothetical protein